MSPYCIDLCLQGCYPYASAGPACSSTSFIDGPAYANRSVKTRRDACAEALRGHGGYSHLHAVRAGVFTKTIFACVGGNQCKNGAVGDGSKSAWKYNFHDDIVLGDTVVSQLAKVLEEVKRFVPSKQKPVSCPRWVEGRSTKPAIATKSNAPQQRSVRP